MDCTELRFFIYYILLLLLNLKERGKESECFQPTVSNNVVDCKSHDIQLNDTEQDL
jgi:hypothetical protein